MSIGKLREFDVKTGSWSSYFERLQMYFKVNETKEEMKLPVLIATIGDEAYELLVNLASPKKPSELTLTQTDELLRHHLQPSPSALAERYRFRLRRQNADENIATYVTELKKLSRYCKFGEKLSENLRDQFVCGLTNDVIRQRLFAESDDVSFQAAVKLATSLEAAERDAAAVEKKVSVEAGEAGAVHALTQGRSRSERARGLRASAAGPAPAARRHDSRSTVDTRRLIKSCFSCGAQNHSSANCKYRDFVCSKCQQVGHLRRVCPGWNSDTNKSSGRGGLNKGVYYGEVETGSCEEDNDDGYLEEDLHQLCLSDYKACKINITIDGYPLTMEVDTGTAISCISKNTYDRYFSHIFIQNDNTVLKFYDGSKLRPVGIIKPTVSYGNIDRELELFIIEGGTTSLLGRQWLSELQIDIPKFYCNFVTENCNSPADKEICLLLDRYKELFSGGLGRYTGGQATLRVREGAAPVFHRARPLPYALRERVDAELDAMLSAGVIEPVDSSDWASPLVPINKPDGTLRICADYKATLNPVLLIDRFPLPKIEDLLVGLNGAQYFSKIDLSQAYNQVELDESKIYTVINTHRGLFRYNRLVYGLASSVGIFQRIMTNLFRGIPNVQVFLDDVIVGGTTKAEHLYALEQVLERIRNNGLKLKKSKCVFLVDEVSYLGNIVSKDGIKADKTKINAISKIQKPENVSELRSFLGLVNFFAKFEKNFSFVLSPLYNLLRKGIEWRWSSDCEQAFQEVKKLLMSTDVLAHYDPNKAVVVTCDASARGVGGVLSQLDARGRERPVAYVSRALTPAEKNYSQIHREALAIVFSMKKFHQYLYGRRFTLRTDHKPLVSIFGPGKGIPTMTASRMQRWAVILSAYDYDIEYVRSEQNCADGLSRLPAKLAKREKEIIPEQTYLHFAQDALLLDCSEIKKQTAKDPLLSRILSYIRDGWPAECEIAGLQPYFNRKRELYEELGCVMWGHRVVIPGNCQARVLEIIHEPHMGIVKSKALARSYVWWGGIDEAVEATCRNCSTCAALADAPPRRAPQPWPWPQRPWSRLHLDFLGPITGKTYLVIVDAMSKWVEIFQVPSTAASHTIARLSELWSRWGIPKQLVSDNGPPFTSKEFKEFVSKDHIDHVFTAPYHPASNGAAENAVRTLKKVIKKAIMDKNNIDLALHTFLLYYRNTEHSSTGESPAMLLMGRRLRTRLDALKPDRGDKLRQAQKRQIDNSGGVQRTEVNVGDDVWFRQYLKSEKWVPGKITESVGSTNFKVSDSNGNQVHRHTDQLKHRPRSSLIFPTSSKGPRSDEEHSDSNELEESEQSTFRSGRSGGRVSPAPTRSKEGSPEPIVIEDSYSSRSESSESPRFALASSSPLPQEPVRIPHLARPVRKCRLDKEIRYKF